MKRRVHPVSLSLLTALAVALLLAACGGSDSSSSAETGTGTSAGGGEEQEEFTVGFVPLNLSQAIFTEALEGFEKEGEEHGFKVVSADAKNDPLTQLNTIQTWLNTHSVQTIVVLPVDPSAVESALKKAGSEDIPVIVWGDAPIQGPMQINTTTDWKRYGEQAGESLADCIEDRLGGKAEVALLGGPDIPGELVTGRIQGEKDAVTAGAPGAEIVAEQQGEGARLPSLDTMSAVLQANPGVNAVTGTNDDSMLGVVKAFKQAGTDPKSVCIVGLDATPEGLAAMKSGSFYATVSLNTEQSRKESVKAFTSLVREGESSSYLGMEEIPIETKVIGPE